MDGACMQTARVCCVSQCRERNLMLCQTDTQYAAVQVPMPPPKKNREITSHYNVLGYSIHDRLRNVRSLFSQTLKSILLALNTLQSLQFQYQSFCLLPTHNKFVVLSLQTVRKSAL
jgi:hypothetical protein